MPVRVHKADKQNIVVCKRKTCKKEKKEMAKVTAAAKIPENSWFALICCQTTKFQFTWKVSLFRN